jgi:hypothetical protein
MTSERGFKMRLGSAPHVQKKEAPLHMYVTLTN